MAMSSEQSFDSTRARSDRFKRTLSQKIIPRILLIAVSALFLLPFYWMVTIALKSNAELSQFPPSLYPHNAQWGNFKEAINAFDFWLYFRNTLVITGLTILGAVISNPIIAYGFSRIKWPGRDKVFFQIGRAHV